MLGAKRVVPQPFDCPGMPCFLAQPAVLYALCACWDRRGRLGIGGKNDETAADGPGKEGSQEILDAGNDLIGEALRQVPVAGRVGGEAESGVGQLPTPGQRKEGWWQSLAWGSGVRAEEGRAVGQGLAVHRGSVGVGAKVLDHGPEAVVGYFQGELASEGVDARPDVG